jgi:LPS export ABC transporter protein LptC
MTAVRTAGVLALACVLFMSCGKGNKPKPEQAPQIPEQAIERFTVTETEGGKTHWVLDAVSARILEKEQRALLQSPHIRFYENGEFVSTLTAERGRINTGNYDIWGEGKCVLDTVKGEHLETSNLYYKSDVKKIMTQDAVKLQRPDEVIYGQGMEASPDLENITIRKQRVEMRGKR